MNNAVSYIIALSAQFRDRVPDEHNGSPFLVFVVTAKNNLHSTIVGLKYS